MPERVAGTEDRFGRFPVNHSAGPLVDGWVPIRVIFIFESCVMVEKSSGIGGNQTVSTALSNPGNEPCSSHNPCFPSISPTNAANAILNLTFPKPTGSRSLPPVKPHETDFNGLPPCYELFSTKGTILINAGVFQSVS